MEKNLEAFLSELAELTKKHNVIIGGCGCCGSPYLYRRTPTFKYYPYDNLEYDDEEQKYVVTKKGSWRE